MPICYVSDQDLADRLVRGLCAALCGFEVWGPCEGDGGLCRLQRVASDAAALKPGRLPFLPLKKLLLPAREEVWRWSADHAQSVELGPPRLVFGLPRCELQALGYLDQVFGEDLPYRVRRERLLVVGVECLPEEGCRCSSERLPLAGDLFIAGAQVWCLSENGRDLLTSLAGPLRLMGDCPLPGIAVKAPVAAPDEADFQAVAGHPVWRREGGRCLSCGACSAVCPTCYCFDMVDAGGPESVRRYRVWDNCFFADHARVAGGLDFRPDRAERLRFRFEHKRLGFGDLRGVASCVGCGRCRRACPVAIDLDEIALCLAGEVSS